MAAHRHLCKGCNINHTCFERDCRFVAQKDCSRCKTKKEK